MYLYITFFMGYYICRGLVMFIFLCIAYKHAKKICKNNLQIFISNFFIIFKFIFNVFWHSFELCKALVSERDNILGPKPQTVWVFGPGGSNLFGQDLNRKESL